MATPSQETTHTIGKQYLRIALDQTDILAPKSLLRLHSKEQYTTEAPVVYIDRQKISERYDEFRKAFPANTDIHYAMKCNPDPRILCHVHALGGNFEIASYAELVDLQQALQDGGSDKDTIKAVTANTLFSNPVKSRRNIEQAFAAGLRRFAFQGINELEKIAQCAPGAEVYLRLTTPAGQSTVASESKFGMLVSTPEEQRQASDLLVKAKALGLVPFGLTFHVGSQMEHADAWEGPLHNSAGIMRELEQHGIRLQMLDMGGGFPAYHSSNLPPLSAFGEAIQEGFGQLPYVPEKLAIEPGRGLVSDAGAMVATVIGTEWRITGGAKRKWIYLNVGAFNGLMESLETNTELRFPVVDELDTDDKISCAITGPSCDGQDTITTDQLLSAWLEPGHRIIFYTAGAYTTAYASRFNGFDVPILNVL